MITIPLHPIPLRILFPLVFIAGVGVLSWVVTRGAIGDGVMTFVQRNPNLSAEARIKGADMAENYAPHDPLVRLGRGGVYLAAATEEQSDEKLDTALAELRAAAVLNPEDYRVWVALGRALDRGSQPSEARKVLERSVQLAPRHFDPRWALGNHLLRAGERDAAFAQFREALAGRPLALPLVFDYAWEAFQGDGQAIAAAIAPTGESQVRVLTLLISRSRSVDALEVWRNSPKHSEAEAREVATAFFNARQMAAAYEVWSSTPMADRPEPDEGSLLSNGSFERPLALNSTTPFLTWQLPRVNGVKVTLDRKTPFHRQQALRAGFEVKENLPMTLLTQTVPVKPATNYLLKYAARTEDLNGWGMLSLEVVDAAADNRLEIGKALPNGSHDWSEGQVKFTTGAKTEAITVRFQRSPCADPPCLLTGRVLLDGLELREMKK